MKRLLVCLAVGCLTIASTAPAEESNRLITKHFKFDNNETLYMASISKEEMVFHLCEGNGTDQKCWIHLDKFDQYDNHNTSCYIPSLKYSGLARKSFILTSAGNSRAVIALRDGRTKLKLISVNLKGCEIYESSFDMSDSYDIEDDGHLDVAIVAHDKNYDVFYKNWKICRYYLCKATIDLEGKVVKAAAAFPLQIVKNEYLSIQYVNSGYLVSQYHDGTVEVYLAKHGEDTARLLLRDNYLRGLIVSSTEENKIDVCLPRTGLAWCKQFDVDGKTKIAEFEFETDVGFVDTFAVQNTETGLILAAAERPPRKDPDEWTTYIVVLDDQGKQQKYVKVDLEYNKILAYPILYKNSNGQYCAIFLQVCKKPGERPCINQQPKGVEFFTSSRCFSKTELF